MQNKRKIQPGSGINVGCADKGILSQTREEELPFHNGPKGTEDVQIFNDMHSPLLSGGNFFKKGCILVFGQKNLHIIKEQTGELIQQIMKKAEQEDSDDIVMKVPFDEQTLTWKTDLKGQAKPLFNIASNIHII